MANNGEKEELLQRLEKLQTRSDTEFAHLEADDALIEFIDDPDIAEAYEKIKRWYA